MIETMPSAVPDQVRLVEAMRIFSAALPAVLGHTARLWNGRKLTFAECTGAYLAARVEFRKTRSYYFAAQAAFEHLSEVAW